MYNSSNSTKTLGFTLIELLVVLVILGITSSLVAPDMYTIVKRTQAKTEIEKIKALAQLSVEQSFFSASQIDIVFKENIVKFIQTSHSSEDNKALKIVESNHFVFEEAQMAIHNGHWQGLKTVKILKSPDSNLKEFPLIKLNGETKNEDVIEEE